MRIENMDELIKQYDARIENLATGYSGQQIRVVIKSNAIDDLPEVGDRFVLTKREIELDKNLTSVIQLFLSKVSGDAD